MWIDEDLSWRVHVESERRKCYGRLVNQPAMGQFIGNDQEENL